MARASERREFCQIVKLPRGRFRARYSDPYGRLSDTDKQLRHVAPHTFASRADAEAWLVDERRLITNDDWTSPAERLSHRREKAPTMGDYAPRVVGYTQGEGSAPG